MARIRDRFGLSPREEMIAWLIYEDKTSREIATELELSVHTVRSFIRRLYRKVDVNSRVRLVIKILEAHNDLV